MKPDDLQRLLEDVASGRVSPADASERLETLPYADLGFAKLDLHRQLRAGLPEAVFAEGKEPEDLRAIVERMLEDSGQALVTRVTQAQVPVLERFEGAHHNARARIFRWGELEEASGRVALLAAGTSDLAVAEEAAESLVFAGVEVDRVYDVGVAGLHRLLSHLDRIRAADVVVVVAGMDGALPTVVAGLVKAPVIAVPTSVGYGASFEGLAPLLTMLTGCAPGVAVVNIDNGYGAAVLAYRFLGASSIASP